MTSLLAVAAMSIVLLMVLGGLAIIQVAGRSISGQLKYQGQALNTASAGLTDALSWLKRQPVQPVTAFSPVLAPTATPPVNDTENPSIGIVRTYEVSDLGNIWARYEVRNPVVVDVSTQRGKVGAGTIWQFDSIGMVFVDRNDNSQLDWTDTNSNGVYDYPEPGEVVASRKLRGEAQRLSLVLPAGNAAVQADNCSGVNTAFGGSYVRVLGSSSGIGIACKSGTGSPTTGLSLITGSPPKQTNVNPYLDSIDAVFGLTQGELIGLANVKVPDVASLPNPLPAMSLIVIQGNANFTTSRPLVGSGILVVFGNLDIPAYTTSNFSGIIYVTGNYSQQPPSQISGAIVVQGNVSLTGGADVTEVDWDDSIIQQVRATLGGYRFSRTEYVIR